MIALENAVEMSGLPNAEYFDVASKNVLETFRIFISKPTHMEPDKTYPVIYVLDGNFFFASVQSILTGMTITNELPPAIIVGVGYDTTDFTVITGKRNRDLTPTDGGDYASMIPSSPRFPFGGGPAFLDFLTAELQPAINQSYPADPDDSTVIGGSFGALFASWVLLTRPETFRRYILCSPAIWWHSEMVWHWEEQCAANRDALNARVFVTAGGMETIGHTKQFLAGISKGGGRMKPMAEQMAQFYEHHGWPRMAEITPEFTARLKARQYQGLDILCHNFADETHMSVWPAGITRGLRYVFGAWEG